MNRYASFYSDAILNKVISDSLELAVQLGQFAYLISGSSNASQTATQYALFASHHSLLMLKQCELFYGYVSTFL